jgi:hypothetical protein
MPIQRLPGESHLQQVRDRDDLHDARADEPGNPLPHGRLRQADGDGDGGIRPPAVLLKLLDDRLRDVVECRHGAPITHRRGTVVGDDEAGPGHVDDDEPGRGQMQDSVDETRSEHGSACAGMQELR